MQMTILSPSKKITGAVLALYVNGDTTDESLGTHPINQTNVTYAGFPEDRHAGLTSKADVRYRRQYQDGTEIRNTRQITILSQEELDVIQKTMGVPEFDAGWIGANIVVSGIPDLTLISPSTRLIFSSGAALVIDNENSPCRYPGDEIDVRFPGKGKNFVKAATNRRGLVAWVEKEGAISVGDDIAVHLPPQRVYPHG